MTKAAPIMEPSTEARPPMITANEQRYGLHKRKHIGFQIPYEQAYSPPCIPVKNELIANESSLYV